MDDSTIKDFAGCLALAKTAIEIAASGISLIPDATKREAAKVALESAKKALVHAELQSAKSLDHEICQCEWPSHICTRRPGERWRCPKCGRDPTRVRPSDDD
jgi:hypothetical protein